MEGYGKKIIDVLHHFANDQYDKVGILTDEMVKLLRNVPAKYIHELGDYKQKGKEILAKLQKKKRGSGPLDKVFKKLYKWLEGKIKMKPSTLLKSIVKVASALKVPYADELKQSDVMNKVLDKMEEYDIDQATGDGIHVSMFGSGKKEWKQKLKDFLDEKIALQPAKAMELLINVLEDASRIATKAKIDEGLAKIKESLSKISKVKAVLEEEKKRAPPKKKKGKKDVEMKDGGPDKPKKPGKGFEGGAYYYGGEARYCPQTGEGVVSLIKDLKGYITGKRKATLKNLAVTASRLAGAILTGVGTAVGGPAGTVMAEAANVALDNIVDPIDELPSKQKKKRKKKGKGISLPGGGVACEGKGISLPGGEINLAGHGIKLAGQGKIKAKGTKKEVYYGQARKTGGGLTKADLIMNGKGNIVSKKMSERGKQMAKQYGFGKKSKG